MNKLDMTSNNTINSNITKIEEIFPNCIIDGKIDFDMLKQELSDYVLDNKKEKYQLTWPGKNKAIVDGNNKTTNTLRPLKEKSVDFDKTKNMYIEGDNLEVLKILQESYLNKIKCIYIDPPYNTGNNLIYKNDYSKENLEELIDSGMVDEDGNILVSNLKTNGRFHSDWLSMMYSRIKLGRNLLTPNGFMILAIDESELANLEKICDEIFGEYNRLGIITVVHKPEGRNQEKFLATSTEYMLLYAKNKDIAEFEKVILNEEKVDGELLKDEKGSYKLNNYLRSGGGDANLRVNKPSFWYPIYVEPNTLDISLTEQDGYKAVYPITSTGVERTWKTKSDTFEEALKKGEIVATNDNGILTINEKYRNGQLVKTHWVEKKYNAINYGTKILDDLMEYRVFDFPKSLYLVEDILKVTTKDNDIILDFFSGSGTTAHAVMDINSKNNESRKFILVQLPQTIGEKEEAFKHGYKTICEIGEERIRRAGKKIKEETNANIDYGFRVFSLASSNMKDVFYKPSDVEQMNLLDYLSNVKEDRTPEDLLTQVMLDLGLTLDLKIEEKSILSNKVFYVEDNSLVACFDDQVDINIIDEICKCNPMKVVFKDISFKTDKDKINLEERIKKLSPETEINIL